MNYTQFVITETTPAATSAATPEPSPASTAEAPPAPAQPDAAAAEAPPAEQPSAPAAPPPPKQFAEPAPVPTQEGPLGIRYDFNWGIRVATPSGKWRVKLRDLDSHNTIFEVDCEQALVTSRKHHYLRGRIEVEQNGETVFSHDYSAEGRKIAVHLPIGTLGDSVGWFPYTARFQAMHGCELTVTMAERLIPLFQDAYPHIRFLTPEGYEAIRDEFYATYYVGLFFKDDDNSWQPADFRLVGLHRTAGYILGVDPTEEAPRIVIPDGDTRPIEERYVVIATKASSQCKYWNNPSGWHTVIRDLKARGYRVICIDRETTHGAGLIWNQIPHGAEDETGNRLLSERARWIKHADAFIGLSSGLAWLAWPTGTPVVLISGFTHPINEFQTPYRVFNTHACNSCWHDVRHPFDHGDFLFCPRHKGTPRQFECTFTITPEQVLDTIDKIPGILPRAKEG